jgi:molybdate transport system substrate-binding protein
VSRSRLGAFAALALALLALGATTNSEARPTTPLTVLAASSLTTVFPQIDGTPRYSFAGSDTLAAQIRLGAPADVLAAASSSIPDKLYAQGLVEKPVVFTTNKLVLVTPASNPAGIASVFDLRRPGIKLVIGTPTVPIGAYTRTILRNLALSSVLSNVVSQETDVRSILGKVALGEADAGFVYATDAKTVASKVRVIRLPGWAQPPVRYEIAIVKSTGNRTGAIAFVNKVLSKTGQAKLRAAGFGAVKHAVTRYVGGLACEDGSFRSRSRWPLRLRLPSSRCR